MCINFSTLSLVFSSTMRSLESSFLITIVLVLVVFYMELYRCTYFSIIVPFLTLVLLKNIRTFLKNE